MEVPDTTQVALGKAMEATLQRHQALAENLANANTPGYIRKDVHFTDALASALQRGRSDVKALQFAPQQSAGGAVRADGGTVDVDQETSEMAANRLHFEALQAVKSGRGAIFKAAAGLR